MITSKKSYANLNEIDYYALETIIPVPGVLSLVSKISIFSVVHLFLFSSFSVSFSSVFFLSFFLDENRFGRQ